MAPNRRQAMIWTNADAIRWRIYAALGADELRGVFNRASDWLAGVPLANQKLLFRVFVNQISFEWNFFELSTLMMKSSYQEANNHCCNVIMGTMASQITSLTIVYSTVYSSGDQRKHQSSESLAFVRGSRRRPVNSPHKWPVTRKMFPFDDVIMKLMWNPIY